MVYWAETALHNTACTRARARVCML